MPSDKNILNYTNISAFFEKKENSNKEEIHLHYISST